MFVFSCLTLLIIVYAVLPYECPYILEEVIHYVDIVTHNDDLGSTLGLQDKDCTTSSLHDAIDELHTYLPSFFDSDSRYIDDSLSLIDLPSLRKCARLLRYGYKARSMTRVSAVQFIKEEWFNLLEGFRRRRDFSLESFRNLYSSISMSFGENVGSLLRFAPIPSLNAHEATVQLDTSCRSWLLLPSRYQRQNF